MARFFLHAGHIQHSRDGFIHISCQQLAEAYGVRGDNVFPVRCDDDLRGVHPRAGDVHLYPRADGDYDLPTPNPED